MARNLEYGRPTTLLPYANQDSYTRERTGRELPSLVLENEMLTATFLPGYGGRLWSLVHRPTGRELLHRNPILQPANLALRDAWLAGGVEWNLGATGHWPLTCSPLHAVRLTAGDGTPVLRMYEFERLRRVVVTVDAWLPAGSEVLLVHVSLHNPAGQETPVYWWSNIAVPQSPDVRVVAPAERAFHFDYAAAAEADRISLTEPKATRAIRRVSPDAADFFMDIPSGERRWIAALDGPGYRAGADVDRPADRAQAVPVGQSGPAGGDGRSGCRGQTRSTSRFRPGWHGRSWSIWSCRAGPRGSGSRRTGCWRRTPAAVHGTWEEARGAVGEALELLVPRASLEEALAQAAQFGDAASSTSAGTGSAGSVVIPEVLHRGSGWGALEIAAGALPSDAPALRVLRCRAATVAGSVADWAIAGTERATGVSGHGPRCGALFLEASADDWHALYHLGLAPARR